MSDIMIDLMFAHKYSNDSNNLNNSNLAKNNCDQSVSGNRSYQSDHSNQSKLNKSSMLKIIKGIGIYEMISKTGLMLTIGLCYRYKPTSLFLNTKTGQSLLNYSKNKFPKIVSTIHSGSEKFSLFFSTNKFLRKIPEAFELKSKKFGKAVAESFVIYHLMIPIYSGIAFKLSK